jgi:protein-S-isoprenylcysteine O-methyltransferase Ste14
VRIASGWKLLFAAQKKSELATTGPYARVRHPQYVGFVLIMVGFLLQWPTFITLAMFPVLLVVYRRLALREEREVRAQFGSLYDEYAKRTPRFLPRLHAPAADERLAPIEGGR